MSGITSISRDWGFEPSIIRLTTTDNLAAITTTGYMAAQAANIAAVNSGPFEFNDLDYVLAFYDAATLFGFFVYDAATQSLTAAPVVPGSLSNTLTNGHVFVGSAGNVATGVAMSGDVHIVSSGAATIQPGAVTGSKIAANAVDYANIATDVAAIASVSVSAVAFNGMYDAPKLLVAAPAANHLLVVDKVELIMTYNSMAFAAGGVVAVQYDSTVHGAGVLASTSEAAADFAATASTTFVFNGTSGNTVGALPFSTTVQKGLYLSNLSGAFTTGDSAFVCNVHYHVVAVA